MIFEISTQEKLIFLWYWKFSFLVWYNFPFLLLFIMIPFFVCLFKADCIFQIPLRLEALSSPVHAWELLKEVAIISISSVTLFLYDTLRHHGLQHSRLPCPLPTTEACSNSCPLSQWCHPTISSSVVPFPSCLQSFPASGFFSNESVLPIR